MVSAGHLSLSGGRGEQTESSRRNGDQQENGATFNPELQRRDTILFHKGDSEWIALSGGPSEGPALPKIRSHAGDVI